MSEGAMGDPAWPSIRKDETSRGLARWAALREASMVGTGMKTVTLRRSMASSARFGSNAGMVTIDAPSHRRPTIGATPATWNIAGAARNTSSGESEHATVLWNALAMKLRWVRITPL